MSDRKYRQRGYQDQDRDERPRRGQKKPPREKREGPWGRGLGAPTFTAFRCNNCGTKIEDYRHLPFDASCPKCDADLHTCTHCANFDPSAAFECREEIPVRIMKKSKRNECELFKPKVAKEFKDEQGSVRDAKAAFDNLFDF
jgi:hypothetical protein